MVDTGGGLEFADDLIQDFDWVANFDVYDLMQSI
jgi:hypothetical protein